MNKKYKNLCVHIIRKVNNVHIYAIILPEENTLTQKKKDRIEQIYKI